jgi:rubrerythrin
MKKLSCFPFLFLAASILFLGGCERRGSSSGTLRMPIPAENLLAKSEAYTLEQHLADLSAAYTIEVNASAKFAAYAMQAAAEGLQAVALLFEATSKSEAVHAANHQAVLEEFGATIPTVNPDFVLGSTAENLRYAVAEEDEEVQNMYPNQIALATKFQDEMGLQSLKYAFRSELKHKALFEAAIAAMQAGDFSTLPKAYYLCPTCGNTLTDNLHQRCEISMTFSDKFLLINRLAI